MLLPYLLYNSELPIFTHKKLPVPGKATFLYRFVKKKFSIIIGSNPDPSN